MIKFISEHDNFEVLDIIDIDNNSKYALINFY